MRRENNFPRRIGNANTFASGINLSVARRTISKLFPVHCHEFYEIEFIISGEGIHTLNGQKMPITRNSIYLLTPVDFHAISPTAGKLEYYNIMFSRVWLRSELFQTLYTYKRPFAANFSEVEANRLRHIIDRLEYEYKTEDTNRMLIMHNLMDIIICDILRTLERTEKESTILPLGIQEALQYIENHFRSPVKLCDIAKLVHLTPSYFSACFKEVVGQPFSGYVQKLRLEYACNLLGASDISVGEVCYYAGFRSMEHFIRCFKICYGTTPGEYRNLYIKEHKFSQ